MRNADYPYDPDCNARKSNMNQDSNVFHANSNTTVHPGDFQDLLATVPENCSSRIL